MDERQFDRWTRLVAGNTGTRRGFGRLAVGAGAALIGGGIVAEEALACRKDRRTCVRDGQCCSGKCKRVRKGVKKCDPAPGAFGCTVSRNSCRTGEELACPKKDDGFCVNLDNGRPFCAAAGECSSCQTDEECDAIAPGFGGRCVKTCRACEQETGGRVCVFARAAPPAP